MFKMKIFIILNVIILNLTYINLVSELIIYGNVRRECEQLVIFFDDDGMDFVFNEKVQQQHLAINKLKKTLVVIFQRHIIGVILLYHWEHNEGAGTLPLRKFMLLRLLLFRCSAISITRVQTNVYALVYSLYVEQTRLITQSANCRNVIRSL